MPSTTPTPGGDETGRPRLAPHVRLAHDKARGTSVLLAPESVTTLNTTGAAIAVLCDGSRTVTDIVAALQDRYAGVDETEVRGFLLRLARMRCLKGQS